MIDSALRKELQEPGTYMHALLKINSLRKFCNIGLESKASNVGYRSSLPADAANGSELQTVVDDLLSSGQAACAVCNSDVRFVLEEDGSPEEESPNAYLSECMRLICLICYRRNKTLGIAPPGVCVDHTPCRLSSASVASTIQSRYKGLGSPMSSMISSKVISLRTELQKLSDEKRYESFRTDLAWANTWSLVLCFPPGLLH
jgi:hypothetical protein